MLVSKLLKGVIRILLGRAGWELRRAQNNNRPTMREALRWLADHGSHFNTVLDVGASDGRWSEDCMTFFPEAKYVLFEPQPVHSKALDSFANTRGPAVVLVKKAVGAFEGSTFFDASDPFGGSLASKEGAQTINVSLTTIDATVLGNQVAAPYLLKLDTHGFEKGILAGANSTLEQCEALIIEAYNFRIADEALLFWELCAFLSKKGFRPIDLVDVTHRTHDNALWQMDLVFIRDTWKDFKYISYK